MNSILPIGMQIRRSLRAESKAFTPESDEWLLKTLAILPAIAVTAVTEMAMPVLPAIPVIATAKIATSAASAATAASTIAVPIAAIAATAAIAVGSVVFVNTYSENVSVPQEPVAIAEEIELLQGDVVFSGGNAQQDNINPLSASVWATNDYGDMTAINWTITRENDDEILLSGEGGEADGIYTKIMETCGPGSYKLDFIMEDAIGGTYMVSRQFIINNTNNAATGEEHASQIVMDD